MKSHVENQVRRLVDMLWNEGSRRAAEELEGELKRRLARRGGAGDIDYAYARLKEMYTASKRLLSLAKLVKRLEGLGEEAREEPRELEKRDPGSTPPPEDQEQG